MCRICVSKLNKANKEVVKVEYHANEKLQNSEKNSICWSKVNVSNNKKEKYLTTLFLF